MFLEPGFRGQRSGWIEVICGSMFSGKTEELIRRLKRARIANQKIQIFKPVTDTRYHVEDVVSHDENSIKSLPVASSIDILKNLSEVNVVGIDEAQFFDDKLPEICQKLAIRGIRVIVAGLDMDYKGVPFGPIPHLLSVAEYITKVHAICPHCGNLATHSYRFSTEEGQVVLGEKDKYEPRCRICYEMGNILDLRIKE
ncbi:MAG: thymidine kinase [Saprospiraceae bacterium]|nr:thymidine kinase [Saprospiraceae bacterium]MBK8851257.1 thymidine kinase [Saprospiraceae bacterium]HMS98563.1 thymidine kinase [Saprospiraceae bacterium]